MGQPRFALLLVVLFACSPEGAADDEGSDEAGASTTSTAPPPGPSADGWASDFREDSAGIGCDDARADLDGSDAARLSFGESAIFVGYEQVGQNQNPVVVRFDGDTRVWCVRHETEGPDGRALGVTWNGGDEAYVVYTVVGGGTALEQATGTGWLGAYAPGAVSGGGPKVSYIGRLDVTSGALLSGTFVIAVKSDNKVNSHGPTDAVIVRDDGNVEFRGASAHKPFDIGEVPMDCTDYPFDSRYVFPPDLSEPVCADCTNCTSARPCD